MALSTRKRVLILVVLALAFLAVTTYAQTDPPTNVPTNRPTKRPTRRPTRAPTPQYPETWSWKASFVTFLAIASFIGMAFEVYPAEWCMFFAAAACWAAEIIDVKNMLAGWSNTGMQTVMTLYVVVKGVDRARILEKISFHFFGQKNSMFDALMRLTVSQHILSLFFNNTPQVALYIPIVRDWARSRGWSPSKFLIPLAHANTFGGLGCMIGTSTNLLVNGLLARDKYRQFGFWEPGYLGIPVGLGACLLCSLLALYLLPDRGGLFKVVRDAPETLVTELKVEKGSVLAGKPINLLLQEIRLPIDSVIKIRRQVKTAEEAHAFLGVSGPDGAKPASPRTQWRNYLKKQSTEINTGARRLWRDTVAEARNTIQDSVYVQRVSKLWGKRKGSTAAPADDAPDAGVELSTSKAAIVRPIQEADGGGALVVRDGETVGADGRLVHDIFPVPDAEPVADEDVIFLATNPRLLSESALSKGDVPRGLKLLDTDALDIGGFGTDFVELIIGDSNPFIGRTFTAGEFGKYYSTKVIAIRHRGDEKPVEDLDINDVTFKVGDAVLVVATLKQAEEWKRNKDFLVVSTVGRVEKPVVLWDYLPAFAFIIILIMAAMEYQTMEFLAIIMMGVTVFMRWVDPTKALNEIDWTVVLMITSALAFSDAIMKSGVSGTFGKAIREANITPTGALWLIYFFCLFATEILTNNAAAALTYPLAISTAKELKVSVHPFAMAIMFAASAGYATPIGYQCNMMVWAPGGYTFMDFVKVGLPLDIFYWITSCIFIPMLWPF